jgi:hypothetical protein
MIPNGWNPIINDHRKRERYEPKVKTLNFPQNALRLSKLKKVLIYETNSSTPYVVRYHGLLNGYFEVKLIEVVGPLNLDCAKGRTLTPSKKLPNTGLHSMTSPSSMVTDREKGMNQKSKL